tara:strand:+ start:1193 stop:1483 length:291 start_codon:yes stop_codon:yes gene_type:complete
MIINGVFSLSLFVSGGHIIDTKLGLHHYSDEDYKEIFFLKNKKSISKECIRHSKLEVIKKLNRSREGVQETIYKVSDPYPIQDTQQQDTFNIQRNN